MRTVYKYPLLDLQGSIRFPAYSKIVKFANLNNQLFLWAEVDTNNGEIEVEHHILGTGDQILPGFKHYGSILDNVFVWHLYLKSDLIS